MKKSLAVLLSLCLLGSIFVGCDKDTDDKPEESTQSPTQITEEPLVTTDATTTTIHTPSATEPATTVPSLPMNTWNGAVASSFGGGEGTAQDPYQIKKGSQLAFLAREINDGKNYTGKYFSLLCDIDLNNRDWTPIGNGIYSFMGNFDGNGHTIKNLKISKSIHYTYEYPTGRKAAYCDSGLFATAQDASIQNLIIDGATIHISDIKDNDTHRVGVLCGTVRTYQSTSVISNIDIKNATIAAAFSTNQSPFSLSIGGAIGHIYAYNNTTTTVSLVETDSTVSFENGCGLTNYVGTILGSANFLDSTFNMENCGAYQTLSVSPEQYYYTFSSDFCGAIGCATASAKPFTVKNVFSKITLNKPALESTMTVPAAIVSNAIIGVSYYHAVKDDPNAIGYKFENVFGCVEHIDTKTGEKNISPNLYMLPNGPAFSQINCCGGETLPVNHGFDDSIWDFDDLSHPKLK